MTGIETDVDWIWQHTRISELARRWEDAKGREVGLLRGQDIAEAEHWRDSQPKGAPAATKEQLEFITASRQAAIRRQRYAVVGSTAAALIALALAGLAFWERDQAVKNAERAVKERNQALTTQSLFLADLAHQKRADNDAGTTVLLALEALPDPAAGIDRPYIPDPEFWLEGALRELRERLVLAGHGQGVMSAAFSPDGKRIVTASDDKTARLWDVKTGTPIGEPLQGHEGPVRSAAFSPDGKRIVTASYDKTVRLWDGESGKPIGEPLRGHEDKVMSAAFSPDGKRIVTASNDKTVRLWNAETGEPIGEPLKGHANSVLSAAFSPDGKRIVSASFDRTARLWDAETGRPIGKPFKSELEVSCAAFSPDGKRVVTGSIDKTARLWDAETGNPIGDLNGHDGAVWSAAFSPDGTRIITGARDNMARGGIIPPQDRCARRCWQASQGDCIPSAHNWKPRSTCARYLLVWRYWDRD